MAKLLSSMAEALKRELDKNYTEWKDKTSRINLNVSSVDNDSDESEESEESEEYEEWYGFEPNAEEVDTHSRKRKHHDAMAPGISRIWKKFEKKF